MSITEFVQLLFASNYYAWPSRVSLVSRSVRRSVGSTNQVRVGNCMFSACHNNCRMSWQAMQRAAAIQASSSSSSGIQPFFSSCRRTLYGMPTLITPPVTFALDRFTLLWNYWWRTSSVTVSSEIVLYGFYVSVLFIFIHTKSAVGLCIYPTYHESIRNAFDLQFWAVIIDNTLQNCSNVQSALPGNKLCFNLASVYLALSP